MSVAEVPRLHFRGSAVTRLPTGPRNGLVDLATHQALTDDGPVPPSTPAPEYHDYLLRRGPRFDATGRADPEGVFSASKGWNFGGNGHFWVDATIISAELSPGEVDVMDPVVGRAVDMWGHYNEYLATTFNRARVFDLDPSSTWTTTLMVGRFGFGRYGRSQETGYMMVGDVTGLHPPRWHHTAYVRDVGDHWAAQDLSRSTVYQFVVAADEGLSWLPQVTPSAACDRLRRAIERADGVVVQFALSNMAPPTAPDMPDRHDLRGTIAPWRRDEPRTYPAGRLLIPVDAAPGPAGGPQVMSVWVGPEHATFNMVNAIPVNGGDGAEWAPGSAERIDLGDFELRTAGTDRLVASVPARAYLTSGFDLTSGIVTVPAAMPGSAVADEPLCLCVSADGRRTRVLAEQETNVQVDDACLVLEHPDRARGDDYPVEVSVRSFVRGRPAPVERIHIQQYVNPRSLPLEPAVASACPGSVALVEVRPGRLGDPGAFAAECTATTDARGEGWFTVRGVRAGGTRLLLSTDGATLTPPADEPWSAVTAYDNEDRLGYWSGAGCAHIRVLPDDWRLDRVNPSDVTFDLIYREVFAYYELLYSFMRDEVFSLADECKVRTYTRLLWQMSDPCNAGRTYFMPPTRDLSLPKTRLLLSFMRAQQAVGRVTVAQRGSPRERAGIEARGPLYQALTVGANLELAATLQYLFAAYSVPTYGVGKEYVRRGLWTPRQLRIACGDGGRTLDGGMRGTLLRVAREEMIHFLVVNNIIMAMGEPFYVPLLDFGTINDTLPLTVNFALEPLGLGSVARFLELERPETEVGEVGPTAAGTPSRYGSVSELYSDIREGIQRVPNLFLVRKGRGGGEHHLFLREGINAVHPDYQLEVDDVASALFAIDFVTEQGEGGKLTSAPPRGESHYESYQRMADELMTSYLADRRGGVGWTPSYPVARNPSMYTHRPHRTVVTDPLAATVMRVFNRSYFLMLQLMVQHFGWIPDASLRRSKLMNAAIDVMTGTMAPLAEVLVTMPSGQRGLTAGPSFELDDEVQYNPRPDIAMQSIALRFDHQARAARECDAIPDRVTGMFEFYADYFRRFPVSEPPPGPARAPGPR
jgi:chromopyrrolic acid synthase